MYTNLNQRTLSVKLLYFEIKFEIRLEHTYFKIEIEFSVLVWGIPTPVYVVPRK